MDAPAIQYAKTSDGVSIAYTSLGEGRPLVFPTRTWGDIHLYAAVEQFRPYFRPMAERGWRVIFYDGRGTGSSQREVTDFGLSARVLDLEAVIDAVGADRLALCGNQSGGPSAMVYAVRCPERVSRLALINTFASGAEYLETLPSVRVAGDLRHIAEDQWEFYTLAVANSLTAFSDVEIARRLAAAVRASISPSIFLADRDAILDIEIADVLTAVPVPTLVVHDRRDAIGDFSALTSTLASRIPGASFLATDDAIRAIDEFLRPDERPADAAQLSGMTAILYADIADSTALTERLGDAAFRERSRQLEERLRAIVRECGGTAVEGRTLGDGVLATFASAREAIETGRRCAEEGRHAGLPLHVGIHAGDVIREEGNVYGGAVNIAARISDAAAAGEVLVSDVVRGLARTSAGVSFEDRGEREMKGVGESMRVWAVRGE